MSEAELDALRDRLLMIPHDELRAPDRPLATALQEAHDLLTLIRTAEVWDRLLAIGMARDVREELEQAVAAARAAQSQWTRVSSRRASAAHRACEKRARALRSELLAASRFHLRADQGALATLNARSRGDSLGELALDLSFLAALIVRHTSAFAHDQTFDPAARAAEAEALSRELTLSASHERLDFKQDESLDLRNRAYTHLARLVEPLRAAGRYAFRGDPALSKQFTSAYKRRKRRLERTNRAPAGVLPEDPSTPPSVE